MIDPLADLALFDLRVLAIEAGPLLGADARLGGGAGAACAAAPSARDAGGGGRREPARRSLAAEGGGGGARSRRGGERSQIAVPGDDEPRNPHAAQRHPRHGRPACATPSSIPSTRATSRRSAAPAPRSPISSTKFSISPRSRRAGSNWSTRRSICASWWKASSSCWRRRRRARVSKSPPRSPPTRRASSSATACGCARR